MIKKAKGLPMFQGLTQEEEIHIEEITLELEAFEKQRGNLIPSSRWFKANWPISLPKP